MSMTIKACDRMTIVRVIAVLKVENKLSRQIVSHKSLGKSHVSRITNCYAIVDSKAKKQLSSWMDHSRT